MTASQRQNPRPHQPTLFSALVKIVTVTICVLTFSFVSYLINDKYLQVTDISRQTLINMGFLIVGALLGVAASSLVEIGLLQFHKQILALLRRSSPQVVASGSIGVVVGLLLTTLVSIIFHLFFPEQNAMGLIFAVTGAVMFGYLGALIFTRLMLWGPHKGAAGPFLSPTAARPKVLDSSVIIDGRALQLCKSRFIEGRILVPTLVLNEIQKIADDSDPMRKQRGRRGLEVLEEMRDDREILLEIVEVHRDKDSLDNTVDAQITAYAKSVGGILVTNDYNLTKVAELRGVRVFNLNLLANTFRKALLPGEIVDVHVVKYGKETGQGIAYLDDGTMIVIESGDKFVGESITVEISSIMQTVAGRLIFARITRDEIPETHSS